MTFTSISDDTTHSVNATNAPTNRCRGTRNARVRDDDGTKDGFVGCSNRSSLRGFHGPLGVFLGVFFGFAFEIPKAIEKREKKKEADKKRERLKNRESV